MERECRKQELFKHRETERDIGERVVIGRSVTRAHARIMKGRNVPMEMKRGFRNSTLLPKQTLWIRDFYVE